MEVGKGDHRPDAMEVNKRITKLNWLVHARRRQNSQLLN